MSFRGLFVAILLIVLGTAADVPLPELRTEPTGGGSIFYIRNLSSQPLTAFLIELVDYPGSSYSFYQDELLSGLVPAGGEKRIQVQNMTVGAVPDYVKMQAALYADGTAAGIPEKIAQLIGRRRFTLETTRELIRRLERAQAANTPKATLIADIQQWTHDMPELTKANRNSAAAFNQAAAKEVIAMTLSRLEKQSIDETLASLRTSERTLASSRPTL